MIIPALGSAGSSLTYGLEGIKGQSPPRFLEMYALQLLGTVSLTTV